jgi:hypothetical protein
MIDAGSLHKIECIQWPQTLNDGSVKTKCPGMINGCFNVQEFSMKWMGLALQIFGGSCSILVLCPEPGTNEAERALLYLKKYSVVVCKRNIATDGPPLVSQLLGVKSVAWSAQRIPTVVNLDFLDQSRNFSLKYLLSYPHEAEWTSFQTHYFSDSSAGNRTRNL